MIPLLAKKPDIDMTPDYSWLQWIKIKLGLRDNEYDTATPGPERPMTGLLASLPPEKRRAALDYQGPEVLGTGHE